MSTHASGEEPGPAAGARIRIAGPTDAELVTRLLHDFNTEFDCPGPDPDRDVPRIERLLNRDDVLVVVATTDPGGHDVGIASLTLRPTAYWDGPLAHLEDLYVRPDLRSRGVGTALLDRARAEVHARGALELHIIVDDADVDARRFYERNGFSHLDPDSGSGMRLFLRQL